MEKLVSDFYEHDAINYASYDNTRKLCGVYDGLKTSQRKLLYTMRKKYANEYIKTESFANICAAFTNYLHGAGNLVGVASCMSQEFTGSNNFALFKGNSGGFGTRINPVFAAGRYTRMTLSEISKILFDDRDDPILDEQIFEGDVIEPKFFVPIFPVIFLNGSDGLSSGFANSIFPRNPKEIIAYIKKKLNGTQNPRDPLLPWFRNFDGSVRVNSETKVPECVGIIERNNTTSYTIKELPIGIDYQKYVEFLDKLCDNNVIVNYTDNCDTKTDKINFEIKTTREFTKNHPDNESLYREFRLIRSLPENLCFIDEFNRVKEYKNIYEIINDFIDKRLAYYTKRKNHLLATIKHDLEKNISKYIWCKGIIEKTIIVSNKKKAEIEAQLVTVKGIIKENDSYDYLLKMPIHSITFETMEELKNKIKDLREEFEILKNKSEKDLWNEDLDKLAKFFK